MCVAVLRFPDVTASKSFSPPCKGRRGCARHPCRLPGSGLHSPLALVQGRTFSDARASDFFSSPRSLCFLLTHRIASSRSHLAKQARRRGLRKHGWVPEAPRNEKVQQPKKISKAKPRRVFINIIIYPHGSGLGFHQAARCGWLNGHHLPGVHVCFSD